MSASEAHYQRQTGAVRSALGPRFAALLSLDRVAVAVGAITLAGAALRLALAGGPMLNDEILSLEHVRPLKHFWDVFWGISHDNNHFLTSLWLYWLDSREVSAFALRAPSILAGAALIPVMAMIARRSSPAAAVIAAALTALSYFFFNYSVEARGYAGLALAFAVAFDATERCINNPRSRARYALAAASGLGALAHFGMIPAVVLLALGAFPALLRRERRLEPAILACFRIFFPAALAMLPAIACFFLGVLVVGWFKIGAALAFDTSLTLRALATAARDTFGLPDLAPNFLILLGAAAIIVGALASRFVSAERKFLYAAIIIGLPAIVFAMRPFNAHVARYYLIVPLALILVLADLFEAAWKAGGARRLAASAALAAILVGDGAQIARFQSAQARPWNDALAIIAASPRPIVTTDFEDRIGLFVRYYNWRDGAHLETVAERDVCEKSPDWLLSWAADDEIVPDRLVVGEFCPTPFTFVGRYATWGLSKVPWALYRRQ
ncbi:MAG TPA: glycosyltransferase family 39 protein [Roseiarcus sp.]|nr:glycosyltransferase family 39 protein [Roseiarcus sp.]